MKLRFLIVVAISLVLVSCAGRDRKAAPSPTPLTATSAIVQLNQTWQSSSSASRSKQGKFLTLLPALSSDRIISVSSDGTVSAVGKDKPSLLWSSSLNEEISAGVGEADGVVVVVSDSGTVIAFDSETGIQRWEQQINQIVFAQPLVYRGKVIFRTIDGNLIGLDSNTGEIVWDAIFSQPEFVVFGSPQPIGFHNLAVVGNATGRIIATDLDTGLEAWQIYLASDRSPELLNESESIPVIVGEELFIADSPNAVVAYNLSSGNLMWEQRRSTARRLAVDDSQVYGLDTNSRVYALGRSDGSIRWEQNALLYRKVSNIALVGGYLIVGDGEGYLHVLDTRSGELAGRARAGKDVVFNGFLTEGATLYVAYGSGRIEAFTLQSDE